MFHSLCRSASSPLQSFLYRHFYRYFDTIHPPQTQLSHPGDRLFFPTNSLPVKQSAKLRLNIQLKNTSGEPLGEEAV